MLRVPSSDGVSVAVHELAGDGTTERQVLLIAHASGFHAHAYLPLATRLAPPFHVFGMDFRGHGDTPRPDDWQVDWGRYGDDALAVADAVAELGDGLVGFGHSMGGAGLLMAASRRPDRFRLLVLFEPIVYPPDSDRPEGPNQLVAGARRRRASFPSIDAAIDNYAAKPPLDAFDPAALDAYVRYGFAPTIDGDDRDGSAVRLKCEPEHEARTFEQGALHRTWELLGDIEVPTVVIAGRIEEHQPSRIAEAVADELPNGRFVLAPQLDHFGPFVDPADIAQLVLAAVDDAHVPADPPG